MNHVAQHDYIKALCKLGQLFLPFCIWREDCLGRSNGGDWLGIISYYTTIIFKTVVEMLTNIWQKGNLTNNVENLKLKKKHEYHMVLGLLSGDNMRLNMIVESTVFGFNKDSRLPFLSFFFF